MSIRRLNGPISLAMGVVLMLALPAKASAQLLQASSTQLSFSSVAGGNAPTSQAVAILAGGSSSVNFAAQITGSTSGAPAPSWLTISPASGSTPGRLVVSVDQTGLASSATPYAAAIQITVPNNSTQSPITIPVRLNVSDAAPLLSATPSVLRFAARVQTPEILEQAIAVDNSGGGGGLTFTTSVLGQSSWISGISAPQPVTPNSPALLRVDVNTQGLAVGSYHDVIHITSATGSLDVPVSLFVSDQGAILGLNSAGLRFRLEQGSSSLAPQTVAVQNLGDPSSTVSWTADLPYSSTWLTLKGSTGTATAASPGTLTLSPNSNAASFPVGASYALVRVSDPNALNSPQYVVAILDVAPVSLPPLPEVTPAGLFFTTSGAPPASQTITISTTSTTPVLFNVSTTTSDGGNWLSTNFTSSTTSSGTPGQISISANSTFLIPGTYRGGVNISMGGVLRTVNVTFVIANSRCLPTELVLTSTSLPNSFGVTVGWPAKMVLQLTDNCGNPVTNGSVFASFSNGETPLPLVGDRRTGNYSATWQPGSPASSMAVTIRATSPSFALATARLLGAVDQNTASYIALAPNGVLHIFADATVIGEGLAPGNVAQVYGTRLATTASGTSVPLPRQFSGTSMLVGDLGAPIYYVSGTQINVQIPSELRPNRQYSVVVASDGAFTLPQTIDVVPLQPGVAVYSGGTVIAQHPDYSLVNVSRPALQSESVIIYLAGMGPTSPSVASGDATPFQLVPVNTQPTVTVDGQNATVQYAGLTPGGVGLYQINFAVPANTRSGNVKLSITQGGITATATLPVGTMLSQDRKITLTPNPVNLASGKGTLTITLSSPAGPNGQIVDLSSSNPAVAAVPSNVFFSPKLASADVAVTPGKILGSTVITASAPGFTSGTTTASVSSTGGTITATSGSGQSALVSTVFGAPLVATVKDASGNPMSGVVVTFAVPPSGASGTFAGGVNTATTNALGVATAPPFTANEIAGLYTVMASAPNTSGIAVFTLTNVGGSSVITATSGSGQTTAVNTAFASPLVATVKDASGNPVSGVVVTFTAPSGGPSGNFAGGVNTATTNASGVATASPLTANANPGSFTVVASTPGASANASFTLSNTSALPLITATSGSGQSTIINTAFSTRLVATVKDATGNPLSGVVVTFTAPSSGASGTFMGGITTATTNGSGMATAAPLTANGSTGSYTVTASAPNVSGTANFVLTNTSGPASIIATNGSNQSAAVNTMFASQLVATVRDASGNPLTGVLVTFTVPLSGAGGTFSGGLNTATTNAVGAATAPPLTANGTTGSYTVIASVAGLATTASFTLTNAIPSTTITPTGGSGQSTAINTTFSSRLVATVKDASGSPLSGVLVTFTAPSSGASGAFTGANSAMTNVAGIATAPPFTANGTAGTYTVTASAPNIVSTAVFSLTNTGGAASIVATSGSNQSAAISTAFLNPLVATVKDVGGNPIGGAVVTFSVPSSGAGATFAGGSNTATTNASGVATSQLLTANATSGTYTVTASVSGVGTPASFQLSNVASAASLTVTNVSTVGQKLQIKGTVSMIQAAPAGGVSVTLTSSDSSKIVLASAATATGSTSIVVQIPSGSTSADFYIQGVASSGTATIAASAAGFTGGSGTVSLAPSGFVIEGPDGLGKTLSTSPSVSTSLTVSAVLLDSQFSQNVQKQAVAGGALITVNLTNSNPTAGAITPSSVTFTGGQSAQTVQFAAASAGSTTVSVNTPAGFTTPSLYTSVSVTVSAASGGLTTAQVTVGQNLETAAAITLNTAASTTVPVTLTSNNPNQLLLAINSTDAGSSSIVLNIPANQLSAQFWVYGLASSGTVTYSASAPGYGSTTGTVVLGRSGIVIVGPGASFTGFTTSVSQGDQAVTLYATLLDSSSNAVQIMQVAGSSSVTATITSSNPNIGTIASPVTIDRGVSHAIALFSPKGAGSTTLTVSTPVGFSTPTAAVENVRLGPAITATVLSNGFTLQDDGIIGKNLASAGTVTIAQTAGGGGQAVTLTSNDANLRLSNTGHDSGSQSITVTIPAGSKIGNYFVYALTDTGSGSYTASASGFTNRTTSVTYAPSGIVVEGLLQNGTQWYALGSVSNNPPTDITVATGALNSSGVLLGHQPLAGSPVTVTLTSSDPSKGTIASPVTIAAGSDSTTARFTALAVGNTTITVTVPAGYATPANNSVIVQVH